MLQKYLQDFGSHVRILQRHYAYQLWQFLIWLSVPRPEVKSQLLITLGSIEVYS